MIYLVNDRVMHATWIYFMSEKEKNFFMCVAFLYSFYWPKRYVLTFTSSLPDEIFMWAFELIQILLWISLSHLENSENTRGGRRIRGNTNLLPKESLNDCFIFCVWVWTFKSLIFRNIFISRRPLNACTLLFVYFFDNKSMKKRIKWQQLASQADTEVSRANIHMISCCWRFFVEFN